jgi:type VI secretion system protein ImpF
MRIFGDGNNKDPRPEAPPQAASRRLPLMAATRIDPNQPIVASVLDRLLDEDPQSSVDPPKSRGQHIADLRRQLQRDIETLLNAHQCSLPLPRELTELPRSLLDYGMPHFLGLVAASEQAREQFRANVELLLRRFEPRFKSVDVTLLENADNLERTLRFRIDALVHADPDPEPIRFDSMLEPVHRRFAVTAPRGD